VFDDTHMSLEDANFLRMQASKFLDGIAPTDRVGIFSSSGQMSNEFSKDKEELKKTLMGLIPRPRIPVDHSVCPDINYWEADQIVNYENPGVLDVMIQVVKDLCPPGSAGGPNAAQQLQIAAIFIVKSQAPLVLVRGDTEAQFVYRFMQDVLRHLGSMPGERVLILASPGFLMTAMQYPDMSRVVEQANRSNIVINTLNARGLYGPSTASDIAETGNVDAAVAGQIANFKLADQQGQASVLQDFAYSTGGVYYENSNDLAAGLNELGAAPEVSYVLGFSPQSQKMDGSFHNLKVSLVQKNKYSIQARHGYYAPRHMDDPAEQAHQEIVAAVFSRDEIVDLPLQIQTQYFKSDAADARLSVVSRIDLKGLHFRKAEGWTTDDLTVATVIFDDNGNYISGLQKILQLKLQDVTYEKLLRTGLTVKSIFDLKPGRYLVRQVVRDSEGAQMGTTSSGVVIP
jgi:VWFA-related protein